MERESDSDSRSPDLPHALPTNRSRPSSFNMSAFVRAVKEVFPVRHAKGLELDATDSVAVLFFTAIAMITRVFRIQFPRYVVFGEGRFGTFMNQYLRGIYFHDDQPPLAKLIMTGVAYYAGYKGDYDFVGYGDDKQYPSMTYVALRITSAFFGALCVPLSYLSMRSMRCSHFASSVASVLVACDLMLVVEARHITGEGIFHFFCCLAVLSIFLYERTSSVYLFIFEGVCLGCAISCNYTAIGIVLLAIVRQFQIFPGYQKKQSNVVRAMFLCLIVASVHFICFSIHLTVLPFLPEGSVPIPDCVREGLIKRYTPDWDARSAAPLMLKRVVALILSMHDRGDESISSPWYSWPICTSKWILFWSKAGNHVLCMSSAFIWYPVLIGLLLNLLRLAITCDTTSETSAMLFGYLFSLLPFALFQHKSPLYNYALPLLFGCYGLGIITEHELPARARGFSFCLIAFLAIAGYFIQAPWAYGLTTPDTDFFLWTNTWVSD